MACCAKKMTKKKNTIKPSNNIVVSSYKEGDDGFVTLEYLQEDVLRIKGCKTKHVFLFANFGKYKVDKNDAVCLLEKHPSRFNEVKISVKSDNRKSKRKSPKNPAGTNEGDEALHESGEQGIQGNYQDVEVTQSPEL